MASTSTACRKGPQIFNLSQIREVIKDIPPSALVEGIAQCFASPSYVAPVVHLGPFDESRKLMNDACIKTGYLLGDQNKYFVVKIATGGFADNVAKGLPTADGTLVVFSKVTGLLCGILLDEGYLTDLRTALAGAVVAKYLAPPAVTAIGIIGSGIQARFQTRLLASVVKARDVVVWARDPAKAKLTCKDIEAMGLGFKAQVAESPAAVAARCNLIVTTTSSTKPLLKAADIRPGTHITAMGADGVGKQELDSKIFGRCALIVADSAKQCCEFGDISYALKDNTIQRTAVVELGDVVLNKAGVLDVLADRKGQITVADLTGVAVQDVAIASLVFDALAKRSSSAVPAAAAAAGSVSHAKS